MAALRTTIGSTFSRVFKDRQILIRSEQGVEHINLRRRTQLLLAGIASGVFMWAVASTTVLTLAEIKIIRQANHIVDMEVGYAELITDLANRPGAFETVSDQVGDNDSVYRHIVARNGELQAQIHDLQQAISTREQSLAALESRRQELLARIDRVSAGLMANPQSGAERSLGGPVPNGDIADFAQPASAVDEWNQWMVTQVDALSRANQGAYATIEHLYEVSEAQRTEIASLTTQTIEANDRIAWQDSLIRQGAKNAVQLATTRDDLRNENGGLLGRLGRMQAEITELRASQEQLFAQLREQANEHISFVEEGLAFTGLDINQLIRSLEPEYTLGAGGPMIPDFPESILEDQTWSDAIDLIDMINRATVLRDVINRLPLATPVKGQFWFSSGFGSRTDPITGRRARHQGLDFASRPREPIYAPGPGTVIFAGRNGAYGNMVEIDHGLGITTRYAHMHTINVERDQEVAMGDEIGLIGNTGRSTGPHLHYEVRLNGRPKNPWNFLQAGEHVLQATGQ
ncbi:MAG: peptidoglycan DD-metalloendopeptidase family protein [Inquilinus sp.]|nr:peptidoglycan DD-metalloendopeptidase family protein [Inquilinus sp.]